MLYLMRLPVFFYVEITKKLKILSVLPFIYYYLTKMSLELNTKRYENVEVAEVPDSYYDAITFELLKDPVTLPSGQTLNRSTAEECIRTTGQNPFTRDKLTLSQLIPNLALRDLIQDAMKKGKIPEKRIIPKDAKGTSATGYSDINLSTSKFTNKIVTCIDVPDTVERKRIHIIAVKDVSGSMAVPVMGTNADGSKENDGSTLSDLVDQSLKSAVKCLDDGDLFSYIEFNNNAEIIIEPTAMNSTGKATAIEIINRSTPSGGTNIWAGLKEALDLARSNSSDEILTKIMIFTDGVSNQRPPKGELGALKTFSEDKGGYPCSVDFIGFGSGNDIDTKMGYQIANETGGRGYYISDGSMIGNVFSNAEGLMLSSMIYNSKLYISVKIDNPDFNLDELFRFGYNPQKIDSNTISIETGPLVYGTKRHFCIGLGNEFELSDVNVTLVPKLGSCCIESSNFESQDINFWKEYDFKREYLNLLAYLIAYNESRDFEKSSSLLKEFKDKHDSVTLFFRSSSVGFKNLLLKDISGEVSKAIEPDSYKKWGKHYLPLLLDAHVFEYANNFKDESCQSYVSEFFNANREKAIEIFENTPLIPTGDVYKYGSNNSAPPVARVMNSSIYGRDAGCFHGLSRVERVNPITDVKLGYDLSGPQVFMTESVPIKNIRPGDKIKCGGNKYSKVEKILVTRIEHGKLEMVELDNGWIGTPNHPVKKDGEWIHPKDLSDTILIDCDATYSFLLKDRNSSVFVNGLESITLAHMQSGDVAEHDFFGTESIVKCMDNISEIMGYHDIVTVEQKWFERNACGLISLIKPTTGGELLDTKTWHVNRFMKLIPVTSQETFESLVRRPIVGDGLDSHHSPPISVFEG